MRPLKLFLRFGVFASVTTVKAALPLQRGGEIWRVMECSVTHTFVNDTDNNNEEKYLVILPFNCLTEGTCACSPMGSHAATQHSLFSGDVLLFKWNSIMAPTMTASSELFFHTLVWCPVILKPIFAFIQHKTVEFWLS